MSNPGADPCVLVIFGAAGDLARRKLLPAIHNLAEAALLPEPFAIVGVARPEMAADAYRAEVRAIIEREEGEALDAEMWQRIGGHLDYTAGELDDQRLYDRLRVLLDDVRRRDGIPANYLFYLAVPPALFGTVARRLAAAGLADEREGWRRLVVE